MLLFHHFCCDVSVRRSCGASTLNGKQHLAQTVCLGADVLGLFAT